MATVDFYFDLSSPYSYLAATQIERLAQRRAATVRWRPMVLFAVFKATGNSMPAQVAAKAQWMVQDLPRWAKQYGEPFRMNSRFPMNTIRAMRLILVGEREGKAAQVGLAAFRALWCDDRDPAADDTLVEVARVAGLDPARALAAIEEPAIKDQLRANTDEAVARGVFGAPTFLVGDQLFWGNDRLHHVEAALGG